MKMSNTKKINLEKIKNDIRRMIIVSHHAHSLFNRFWFLRAPNIVGQAQAELNVKIYKDFGSMFTTLEESCLVTFATIFRQLFDHRKDVVSLYYLNSEFGKNYKLDIDKLKNLESIKKIIKLRHKFFAHKDNTGEHVQRVVPSNEDIKEIYSKIWDLYGKITGEPAFLHDVSADELASLFKIIEKSNPRRFKL